MNEIDCSLPEMQFKGISFGRERERERERERDLIRDGEFFVTKCVNFLLQSASAFVVLQSASACITKCVSFLYYKVR